jgi:N-acetylmuramoyl-L-alanine amidase
MNARLSVGLVFILLSACASPQRKLTPLVHEQIQTEPEPAMAKPDRPTPPITDDVKPEPKPVPEPVHVKPTLPPPLPEWISLQDWCAQNKLDLPLITVNSGQTNISIRSDAGVFEFEPPRRNARWNGILVGIGFSPQFTNQQTLINAIDINKVLRPLLLTNDTPRKRGGIVVIDAGHGGTNSGALSQNKKLKEKELTLDWARRVEKLLEGSQWKVLMTRNGDTSLGLSNRVALAEEKKADLFISLHFNSFSNGSESGLETYCMTPVGMASHVTRNYADDMNVSVPNNEFDEANIVLAYDMHRAMLRKTGRKDRGVRRARFMTVLRDQRRPSVLLEAGFLSNPEEARLISAPEYRQKLAEAVAEALGVTPPTLTSSRE